MKKKGIWILLALLLIWYGIAMGLRAGMKETLSDGERAFLMESLRHWEMDSENASTGVLYDAQRTPRYMYVFSPGGFTTEPSEAGYLIYDRFSRDFCSGGDGGGIYMEYQDVQQFYEPPLTHVIASKDLPEEIDPAEDGYYLFGPGQHLEAFRPGVIHWLWSNLKLPAQAIAGIIKR